MTNHELRLTAAKAAGYTIESDHAGFIKRTNALGLTEYWNPLEVDADAFRLMVDLKIRASFSPGMVVAVCDGHHIPECTGTDKHAATRRAIVRAAAAMGGEG